MCCWVPLVSIMIITMCMITTTTTGTPASARHHVVTIS